MLSEFGDRGSKAFKPSSLRLRIRDAIQERIKPVDIDFNPYSDKWKPGDDPTSVLARDIIRAYLNDDYIVVIVQGRPRIGKSAYVLKVMIQVYDYLFGMNKFDVYKYFVGWLPQDVINFWVELEERIPCYMWDDAGCWIFTLDWHDPLLRELQRYMNVIGTDINVLILTTPSKKWILKKVGEMPGSLVINIRKTSGMNANHFGYDNPSRRWGREAIGVYPDRWNRKTPSLRDQFSCFIPQDLYDLYAPTRKKYAKLVSRAMKRAVDDKIQKALEMGKDKRKITDSSYAIYQEVYKK